MPYHYHQINSSGRRAKKKQFNLTTYLFNDIAFWGGWGTKKNYKVYLKAIRVGATQIE